MIKLVLEANIKFSIMKPDSIASYLFFTLKAKFFAPEYIESEMGKHRSECLLKSKLSEHEFELWQNEVDERIKFCSHSEYEELLEKSISVISDREDAPYLALALAIKAAIWSNDPHLKQQSLVKVHNTKELVDKLLKGEL